MVTFLMCEKGVGTRKWGVGENAARSGLVMVVRRKVLEKEWLKFGFWGFRDE